MVIVVPNTQQVLFAVVGLLVRAPLNPGQSYSHLIGVMRLHEIMGIEQSRKWGVCSLNDFRKVRTHVQALCN